jgi:serine phosphatase RsbU (regulator of sigma subunit)
MKLGTKLILAFLLLAILPLTWITLYSYYSSINAFRKAVEAESGTLADEMGGRMEEVKRDLTNRVERLARFPFTKFLALEGEKAGAQSKPLMNDLMAEIGDAARLVDTIEFSPSAPPPPGPSPHGRSSKPAAASSAKSSGTSARGPHNLVIHLSPEAPPSPTESRDMAGVPSPEGFDIHIRPSPVPPALSDPRKQLTQADMQKAAERLKPAQEFRVFLEQMKSGPNRKRPGDATMAAAEAAMRAAGQAVAMQRNNPLASNFGSEVRSDGAPVGTMRARVSSPQVFQSVLSRSRRRQGEIPFIIDADNKLHTVLTTDQKKLEALKLPGTIQSADKGAGSPQLADWVVVTRKDGSSKQTFGIARPNSGPLRDIRNTAARNLGFGLGMVALALVGIIPFSNHMRRNLEALTRGANELARGNLDARVHVRSRDEIGQLAESFNRMAHDLNENQKHLVEQERMRKELEMSRKIQEELLPKRPLHIGLVEAKGVSIPAREVGGDFFNYFPLPGGELAILVGDVSGKGVAAAILMANLQATLQARLPLVRDLDQLARQLDYEISASTPQEVFLALFMAVLSPGENQLRYVNAGHNPQFALHSTGGLERLESTGRPLGLLPGGDYVERRINLSEGDALFLYTDGLVEAEDTAGREFGQQRLENLLIDAQKRSINEILALVELETRQHRGENEAADDATMLVLKIGT